MAQRLSYECRIATSDFTDVPASAGLAFSNSFPICAISGYSGSGVAVRPDQRSVILLLSVQRAAPLPVAHRVGAVSDVVPRHGAHLALVEPVVDVDAQFTPPGCVSITQKFLPLKPRVRSCAAPFFTGSRCPCPT